MYTPQKIVFSDNSDDETKSSSIASAHVAQQNGHSPHKHKKNHHHHSHGRHHHHDKDQSHQKSKKNQKSYAKIAEKLLVQRKGLPIYGAKEPLVGGIKSNSTVIVVGETGSGKTTQIPQFLLEAGFANESCGGIAVTQPRRVAAISIAKRVAEEVGTPLGGRVGYSVRFDDMSSEYTQIKYLTDGMLLREVLLDPMLKRYQVVVLDEAHERTLRTDILMGMLKQIQKRRADMIAKRRKDRRSGTGGNGAEHEKVTNLKIVVMSATLDAERFSKYFDNAPILYVAGRQHHVTVYNTLEPQPDYLDAANIVSTQVHLENPVDGGDVLVFLAGQDDIENMEKLIHETNSHLPENMAKMLPCPIFAALPTAQQAKVFQPAPPGFRKIVLATNIAETSVTIPGIRYVIDTGVHKVRDYDARVGVESLQVQPISKSSARQRTGRAGREAPGACYRLYMESSFQELDDDGIPEIKRCNLAMVVIQMKASGISDIMGFEYMDPPSKASLKNALLELYALAALDDHGHLTDLGRWMAEFPLEPSYSKVIYESQKQGCTKEAINIVSLLSVDSIFYIPNDKRDESMSAQKKFSHSDGDHLTYLNLLDAYIQANGDKDWCRDHFVNIRNMQHVLNVRKQLVGLCNRLNIDPNMSCGTSTDTVLKCFLAGFFHHCALLQPDNTYRTLNGSQTTYIHPGSSLFGKRPPAIFYDQLVFTNKLHARSVSAIDPSWIATAAPKLYGHFSKSLKN
ncbi:ATP-dependent RNA helicase [Mycoemilia scoparia]|uniref:RNA helicase n=1 Tax=Mycoemilia scoparia TaxID=417184 RepID=A0A9W8DTH1_9FUNG|nr:ATP-dependent RNA helicase [Mycoemilia scoparia]